MTRRLITDEDRAKARAKYHANKEPYKKRNIHARFRKFGLTKHRATLILKRQHGKCLTCRGAINLRTGTIDHNHETGVVRGWLCRKCNMVLGLVAEQKLTLRRMIAYLDYDRTKLGVYIMGSLRNPKVMEIASALRKRGYVVYDDWMAAGATADDNWQAYETQRGRTFGEALAGRAAQSVYQFDRSMLDLADCAVLVMPSGKSAHMEAGYMRGVGKPVFMYLSDDPERFDVMPQFVTMVCYSLSGLVRQINKLASQIP